MKGEQKKIKLSQSKGKNRNSSSGENSNEDMEVCATKIEQDFDRYQVDHTTDESSGEGHRSNNRNSRYILRTRAKKSRSLHIQMYYSDPDSSNVSPLLYLLKRKRKKMVNIYKKLVGRG